MTRWMICAWVGILVAVSSTFAAEEGSSLSPLILSCKINRPTPEVPMAIHFFSQDPEFLKPGVGTLTVSVKSHRSAQFVYLAAQAQIEIGDIFVTLHFDQGNQSVVFSGEAYTNAMHGKARFFQSTWVFGAQKQTYQCKPTFVVPNSELRSKSRT